MCLYELAVKVFNFQGDNNDVCFNYVQIPCNDNANTDPGHGNLLGTNSAELLDNKEIDDTLDEFSKLLSDYSCDSNPTDREMPSPAQARLESLFVPPGDRNDNPLSPAGPRLPATAGSAAKENPAASTTSVEDEASVR